MFRRNQIVWHEVSQAWSVPARVMRRVSATQVAVINTLGRISVVDEVKLKPARASDVERYDDQGSARQKHPVVRRMPSLRKLKQNASWYYWDVWKKPKGKFLR